MCFSFAIIKIDCDQDSTIKIDNSLLNEAINDVEQSIINSGTTTVSQVNVVNIDNASTGVIDCNNLTIGTYGIQTTQIINQFNSQQISQIKANIASKVQNEASAEQNQGLLAFLAASGDQTTTEDVNTRVTNIVVNAVTQDVINRFWATDAQSGRVNLLNYGTIEAENCNFVASNQLNLRVTNIANTIQTSLQQDAFLNQILTFAQTDQRAGTDLSDIARYLIIGAVVIVVIIIIAVLLFVFVI